MKKTLLIAMLFTLSAGTAVAQQQGGPDSAPGHNGNSENYHSSIPVGPAERLTERLGLDEAQAAEIAAIYEEAQLLRDQEREKLRLLADEIRANTHAQIRLVLTPEQQALFDEQLQIRDQLKTHLEDMRAERGFGTSRGLGDCINN